MTDAERFALLAEILKTHDTLTCHVAACPTCARYYQILLTVTQ